jgi:undecaprenyl-diphosphatase
MVTYLQALILGLLQGLTELFPISSLGHSVLVADLFNWQNVLSGETTKASTFLLFIVVLHVATALALVVFYRREWVRIIRGFFSSLSSRSLAHPDAKLAWLLIAATIPAALIAFVFQTFLQNLFAKPLSAIIFLIINGCILFMGDRYIQNHRRLRQKGRTTSSAATVSRTSDTLTLKRAGIIGVAQVAALFAGISRSGITMVSGIYSGLAYEDAARFSFLLATPIILLAGIYKLPSVIGHKTAGMHGQMIVGGLCAAIAAYFAVRFLDKYFQNRTLRPFAYYCVLAGVFMLIVGLIRGHF